MRIVINPLDPKSVSNALKQIRKYQDDFQRKEAEFCRRLAEIGVRVAQATYDAAGDYNETSQIVVSMKKESDGYLVLADGEKVGFVEFGTGIKNREWNNTNMDYTPPAHGTYGKGRGAQPWGWWYYPEGKSDAVHTYGEVPVEAMRLARDEMVQQITQIAREVWK